MKPLKTIQCWMALAVLACWAPGCATRNVNPAQARANTGYVDFYADSSGELSWRVARLDEQTQGFKDVFSEFAPVPGRGVRLALAPGRHRLQVSFINRLVRGPGVVEVEVKEGMITPVHVVLISDGTAEVQRKENQLGRTVHGYAGRRVETSSDPTVILRVSCEAHPPIPYQVKERMVYAP